MRMDAYFNSDEIGSVGSLASDAEDVGFDGFWVTEADHSPVPQLTLAAAETTDIDVGSAITVAFPRSPMVTAYTDWDLQRLSNGRLTLGIGTQVKGHIQRRFSMNVDWDHPGPRFREYVEVLRHLWECWQTGADVRYEGEYYQITLCPAEFTPSPLNCPLPDLYIGGVNPFNLKLAGHLCDGLHIHPLHTPKYIEDVIVPNVTTGADIGNRDIADVTLSAQVFAITGSEAERETARESVREQIGFYGSTRTYRKMFEIHGWGETVVTLHDLSKAGRWDELADHVTDEMLDAFTVEAPWPGLKDALKRRYKHVDRVSLYASFDGGERWRHLVQ